MEYYVLGVGYIVCVGGALAALCYIVYCTYGFFVGGLINAIRFIAKSILPKKLETPSLNRCHDYFYKIGPSFNLGSLKTNVCFWVLFSREIVDEPPQQGGA